MQYPSILALVLSAVFCVAGTAKLLDLPGAARAAVGFGVPVQRARVLVVVLAASELAFAALVAVPRTAGLGAALSLGLLVILGAGTAHAIRRGRRPLCHCLGRLYSRPVGPRTILNQVALAVLACVVIWEERASETDCAVACVGPTNSVGLALTGMAALLVIGLACVAHLIRQQGRILIRLRALEESMQAPRGRQGASARLGHGSRAPDFTARDAAGHPVAMRDLLLANLPNVFVFTAQGCPPCEELITQLLASPGRRDTNTVVLIDSTADPPTSPREGLRFLSDQGGAIATQYGVTATPSAVRVTAPGTVETPPLSGLSEVLHLLGQAANHDRSRHHLSLADISRLHPGTLHPEAPEAIFHEHH